ncbi:MAG: GLUG motif-containing protein [Rikenellaceae bacterium]
MKEVTVTVSTSQTGDQATRVAIEEDADSGDLLLTWADNDALGGWSWNASSFSIFEIDNESIDSTRKSATFNGSIYEEDDYYRLMHPYIAGAEFTDQTYTIDFAAQSTDMEQDEYYTLGQGLYMISSSIDSRGTEAPVMMHIGAVLDINLRFENLPEDVSVKLASLKIEGSETLEIPQSATIDFRHDVADDSFVKSSTGGAIEVEAKNSPALSATETYTLKASTMPFTFGADEELTMTVVLTSSTTKYTKSFTLANNSGDAIEVERAMYLTLNKMCDMDGAEQSAIDGLWDGSIADDFSGGDGSSTDPYLISSAAELAKLAQNYSNYSGGTCFALTCEINLGGLPWTPIGNYDDRFDHTFDGRGYTISGLYIDSEEPFQGLFGYVNDGTIANLTVEGEVTTTDQNSAGIAGMAKYTTILNCHNRATIKGTSRVGGVAGGAGYATIYNCSNTGTITGDDYSESNGSSGMVERVGGIAGTSAVTYLYNCFNAGAVSNLAGQAYALAAPSGDDNYSTYTTYCYYDENCGGVNTNTSASGVSSSYMLSAEFVDLLNEKAIYLRKIDGKDLKFWESVDGSYPTTTMEDAVESSTTSSLIELDGDFSDWDAVSADALATASMDGYTSGYPDLLEMKFCADETYIYTYFKIETANNNHELLIFINSTGDAADGYSSWMWDGSLYADYMIISTASGNYADDAALYAFDTADTSLQWSWIWTGVTGNSLYSISDVVTDGTIVEFEGRIVRDSMTGLGDEIEVGVMIDDNNWATIGVLPALTTGGAQAPLIVKLP